MKRPEALDTLREQKVALERLLWEADRHSIHTLHPEYVHPHRTPESHHEYQRVMADYLMRHGAEVAAAILGIAPPGYVMVSAEDIARLIWDTSPISATTSWEQVHPDLKKELCERSLAAIKR